MSLALRARRPIRWPASKLALFTGALVMFAALTGSVSRRAAVPAQGPPSHDTSRHCP